MKTVDKYGKPLGETGIAIQIQNIRLDVNFQFEREDTVIGLDLVEKLLKLGRMSRENLDNSKHKDLSGEINIILTESVDTFDPLFIAVLCMMKKRFPDVKFQISSEYTSGEPSLPFLMTLFQVLVPTSQFFGGLPVHFSLNGRPIHLEKVKNKHVFVASRRFLPVILIDREKGTYSQYFRTRFREKWEKIFGDGLSGTLGKLIEHATQTVAVDKDGQQTIKKKPLFWEPVLTGLIRHIQNFPAEEIRKGRAPDYISLTAVQIFMRAIWKIKGMWALLGKYEIDTTNERILSNLSGKRSSGYKGFTNEDREEWNKRLSNRIESFFEKPIASVMILALVILNSEKLFKKENLTIEGLEEELEYKIRFSEELFDGIRELAKNIHEHSTSGVGCIVFRAFDYERLARIKPPVIWQRLDKSEDSHAFINIAIVDDSERGILMTLEQSLKNIHDNLCDVPREQEIVRQNIDRLKNRNRKPLPISSLFEPGEDMFLNQNLRTASGMGLLLFSDLLVKRNNGCAFISTVDGQDVLESPLPLNVRRGAPGPAEYLGQRMPFGTLYDISFPVKKGRVVPRKTGFKQPSMDESIDAFEALVNLHETKVGQKCKNQDKTKKCFRVHMVEVDDIDKKKGWVDPGLCPNAECTADRIIVIQLISGKKQIDLSNLLRFLTKMQLDRNCPAIVVYPLGHEIANSLNRVVNALDDSGRTSWSNTHYVLFFLKKKEDSFNVFLPWLLAGQSRQDRLWINRIIQLSTPLGFLDEQAEDDSAPSDEFLKSYPENPLFSSPVHLLPLEVLLNHEGLSLFEWNAMAGLMIPISVK